jgi:hypothetical protein
MAETAFQTQYRQEFIAGFEQRQALIRQTVTTESMVQGNSAVFLVADSNDEEATTRGVNGLIPAKTDNLVQNTATLVEWHDLRRRTRFNIFASQGDGRRIMQMNSMAVINRKIDQDIITELNTATQDTGAAVTASLTLVMKALAILGNEEVPMDSNISGVITPAFLAYLMQLPSFASADYVNNKPFTGQPMMFRWANVNWIVHPRLPGKATNAEKTFMYHKDAIGHAVNVGDMSMGIGYDEEQDYSWARASVFMASKLLQNSGVVVINHDGSAFVAA